MTIRLALAGLVLVAAGAISMPQARDASVLPLGKKVLESGRAASPVVEVQQKRRGRRVNTRETAPETSAIPPGKAVNGEVLFEYQTNKPYPNTVNGVEGKGGGLDSAPYVAGDGTLFVQSGYARFGQPPGNVLLAFRPRR